MDFYKERDALVEFNINELLLQLPSFCRLFFENKKTSFAKLTLRRCLINLKNFFEFISNRLKVEISSMEIKNLNDITPSDVQYYIDSMTNACLSAGYKKNILSTLNTFFIFYKKLNLIAENVIEYIDRPKEPEKPIVYLTTAETKKLLDAVNNDIRTKFGINKISQKQLLRDKTILTLFLSTGIRLSELVGLNCGNVDMINASISIRRSKSARCESVYMTKELQEQLSLYLTQIKNSNNADEPLFLSNKGNRIQTNTVEIMVKKYAKLAGIQKKITPHKLRATFGTNIYKSTHDIYLTARLLGHNNVNTTTKYYVDLEEEIKRRALEDFRIA